jgi:hypothetical protein
MPFHLRKNSIRRLFYYIFAVTLLQCSYIATAQTNSNNSFFVIGWNQSSSRAVATLNFNGLDIYAYDANDNTGRIWYSVGGGSPLVVGGNTFTRAAPALVEFNNQLYIFHTGIDGQIYWDTLSPQGTFNGNWRQVPGGVTQTDGQVVNTSTRPAVTVADNQIVIAAVFGDGHMRWNTMDTSNNTHGWGDIGGNGVTSHDISILTLDDNFLLVIHTGTDGHIYYNVAENSFTEFFWQDHWTREPGNGLTNFGPTGLLVPDQSRVYIGVDGLDGQLWAEELVWDGEDNPFLFFVDNRGAWGPQSNQSTTVAAAPTAVGMGYLRGNGPAGNTNPTAIVDAANSGNLIVRRQLN